MKCQRCGGDTSVYDSRLTSGNEMRRRRQCDACGHRVTTWESTTRPPASGIVVEPPGAKYKRDHERKRRAAMSVEERRAKTSRAELRKAAKAEAAQTGEPVAAIYARWGCE